LALYGGEWSASRPGRFTHGTPWIGEWVGPTAGLDAVSKSKNPCLCREQNPDCPARSLVIIHPAKQIELQGRGNVKPELHLSKPMRVFEIVII